MKPFQVALVVFVTAVAVAFVVLPTALVVAVIGVVTHDGGVIHLLAPSADTAGLVIEPSNMAISSVAVYFFMAVQFRINCDK